MARVAIIGGCVTRDAFGQYDGIPDEPCRYVARSALASAMCPVPFEDVDLDAIAPPFERRMVEQDLRGDAGRWVREGDYDLVVMDCMPERNALFVDPSGAIATRSSQLMSARPDVTRWRLVRPADEEFRARWEAAWVALIDALDAAGARDRLRINRVRWAREFDAPGATFSEFHSPQRIRRSNAFLKFAYERMARDLEPQQFYRYRLEEMRAATVHQWGVAPFHFTRTFYDRFAAHLARDISLIASQP